MMYAASQQDYDERERARAVRARANAQRQAALRTLPLADFLRRTKIEVPVGETDTALAPFDLWPSQHQVLDTLTRERLVVFLKARQLGISWLTCGFVLHACTLTPGQPWLLFSQGQLEANELTRRIGVLYHQHSDLAALPRLVKDNTQDLLWDNGSRVLSLPATKKAGRSFTAAGVVLDEWAFMTWGRGVLAAVKPTIDAGGKLIIISSADGPGTSYHRFWESAKSGSSGYTPIFLPWFARPDRDAQWRDRKIAESNGDEASILREYPANDIEAFTNAAGLVYDTWSDGPPDGNVTEAAEYQPDGGLVLWAIDDGYAGKLDGETGTYTAASHPRVFLLAQQRPDGTLCVFAESYAVEVLSDDHIETVLALPYPEPDWAAVDSSAAELRGRLHDAGIATLKATHPVKEGVKETRRRLGADKNGKRTILVHPRCKHLRSELASYRVDAATGEPVKQFDHGCDALRYLVWKTRFDQ